MITASTVSASKRLPVSDGCVVVVHAVSVDGVFDQQNRPQQGSLSESLSGIGKGRNSSATVPPAAVTTVFILPFQMDTAATPYLPWGTWNTGSRTRAAL